MKKINVKYRTWNKGVPPKPIKVQVPGWAGEKNYETGQPWHCKPFVDGATYGLEIIYPFETEVIVSSDNGIAKFEYKTDEEWKTLPSGVVPFANFARNHFGFTSSLDIKTEPGYGTLILPHPRFFTDTTGDVPVPSLGLIESDWWPKIFFIAFKCPLNGTKYVFRKGEGIAQVLIVEKSIEYEMNKMSPAEETERHNHEIAITLNAGKIATRKWKDADGNTFDNKYRVLSSMETKGEGATKFLNNTLHEKTNKKIEIEDRNREKMKRILIPSQKRHK